MFSNKTFLSSTYASCIHTVIKLVYLIKVYIIIDAELLSLTLWGRMFCTCLLWFSGRRRESYYPVLYCVMNVQHASTEAVEP